ncbi:hypothetical protein D3C87_233890 [compost metagenome]
MSVNLNISFEIHNIQEIHTGEDETKRNEIYDAAKVFLDEIGILDQDMIIDFAGQDGNLVAYNAGFPLSISRSYLWIPEVTSKWEELAIRILGPTCKPIVDVDYPDED